MEVKFRTNTLEKQYRESKEAIKAYGEQVGKKFIERVNIIKAAKSPDELLKIPTLRCHPLKGKRAGEWAIKLTGFYRLIFTLEGDKPKIVRIEDISKHYED